jgi:hypothetical protein
MIFNFFKETKASVNLFSDFPSIPRFSACRLRGSGGKEKRIVSVGRKESVHATRTEETNSFWRLFAVVYLVGR